MYNMKLINSKTLMLNNRLFYVTTKNKQVKITKFKKLKPKPNPI